MLALLLIPPCLENMSKIQKQAQEIIGILQGNVDLWLISPPWISSSYRGMNFSLFLINYTILLIFKQKKLTCRKLIVNPLFHVHSSVNDFYF